MKETVEELVRSIHDQASTPPVLEFSSEEELAGFMDDPRRSALADVRNRAIARTDVFRMRPG